jgi:hypothetical protein
VATTQSFPQAPPAPKVALLVMCVECGEGVEALMPIEHKAIAILVARHGWFMSVLTPPNQNPEVPVLFGVLCSTCAPKIFPPEVLKAAEEQRQAVVKMAQAPQPPQGTR